MNQRLATRYLVLISLLFGSFSTLVAQQNFPVPLSPSSHGGNPGKILDLHNPENSTIKKPLVYDYGKLGGEKVKSFPTKRSCFTMEAEQVRRTKEASESLKDFESWLQNEITLLSGRKGKEEVYTLPVVVHVVYSNKAENITDEQVKSQISVLNQDYRRLNADKSLTDKKFQKIAADTKIQFQLARRDPDGNATNGINRVAVGASPLTPDQVNNIVKPNTIWNPNEYLNIWVCNLDGGILGFSQFPSSSGLTGIPVAASAANTDGVVIHYQSFGTMGTATSPFNLGRTTTHEIGHWLGALHLWGEGGCNEDDHCADTPPVGDANFGCEASVSTCDGSEVMTQNFMDYVDDVCMNLFTQDQKSRMRAVLMNSPRRNSLLRSSALDAPSISPSPSFSASVRYGCEGMTVQFSDQSEHQPTSYQWEFPGGTPARSNEPNPTVVYPTAGSYNVELSVSNSRGHGDIAKAGFIQVVDKGLPLPQYKDFELAALERSGFIHNPDNDVTWKRTRKFGGFGTSTGVMYIDNFNGYMKNSQDWFILPSFDFSEEANPALIFDIAYDFYNENYSDTLGVFVSVGCGSRFQAIYYKGGIDLETAEGGNREEFQPTPDDWRKESIDLTSYAGQSQVQIAFVNLSGGGNFVYLDNIRVEAQPKKKPNAEFKINQDRICAGEKITFSDISDFNPTNWKWSFPGASVVSDTVPNPVVFYPKAGTYDVSLTVSNEAGQDTEFRKGIIKVYAGPDLTITGPAEELCPGETFELIADGGKDYHWEWAEDGGEATGPRIRLSSKISQIYHVTASDSGCTSITSFELKLKAEDVMKVTPEQSVICEGETINLRASGASSFTWLPSTGLGNLSGNSISVKPTSNTVYRIVGVMNECQFEREVFVEVKPKPDPRSILIEGLDGNNELAICRNESVFLQARGAASFQWYPGDGLSTDRGSKVLASPLLSTNYTLIALNEFGCVSEIPFKVNVVSVPDVKVYPEIENICRGENIELMAEGAISYEWISNEPIDNWNSSNIVVRPEISSSFTVVGKNELGCADTADAFVYVQEPSKIHINTQTTTLCPGEETFLSASGAIDYQWRPSAGLNRDFGPDVVASPDYNTTYTLRATDEYGCITETEIDINIANDAPPTADFDIIKPFICVGEELQIKDYSQNAVQHFWSFQGSNLDATSERFPRISYSEPGVYDAILVVQGCQGDARVVKRDAVRVSPPVPLQPEQSLDDLIICKGQSLEISAAGAETYHWLPAPGLIGQRGSYALVKPEQSQIYTVVGRDYGGCEDTLRIPVEVRGVDNTINIFPSVVSICEGDTIELSAEGADQYRWISGEGLDQNVGSRVFASPNRTTVYEVEGADLDGCVRYGKVNVEVKPKPSINLQASSQEICEGEEVVLSVSGADTYEWASDVSMDIPVGDEITVYPTNRTIFYVRGTNNGGCAAEAAQEIEVHPKPIISLDIDRKNICEGDTAVVKTIGADRFRWLPNTGVVVSTGEIAQLAPKTNTDYRVEGLNQWGCVGESSVKLEVEKPSPLQISPDSIAICAGESVALNVSGGNGNYYWEKAEGMSANSGEEITVSPSQTTTYVVHSYAANMDGCVNSGSLTVLVKENIGINLITSVGSLCEGEIVELDTRGISTGELYSLNAEGDQDRLLKDLSQVPRGLTSATAMKTSTSQENTTMYELIGTDVNGCKDTARMEVELVEFDANFDNSSRQIDLAETGGIIQFEDQTPDASEWKWTFEQGAAISYERNPTHIFSMQGIYEVKLWVSNGTCHKEFSQEVNVINSSRTGDLKQLKLDPVNNAGRFALRFRSLRQMYFDMELEDSKGASIFSDVLRVSPGDYERFIDLSHLPAAEYRLKLYNGEDVQTFELKVEKE